MRLKPRAKRCSAAGYARCAPFRTDRSRGPPCNSWRPHQVDKDFFQRSLRGLQVREFDSGATQIAEQAGDAGALAFGIVVVDQPAALIRKFEVVSCKHRRDRLDPAL